MSGCLREGVTKPGDYGVLMTMGPGSTIETALIQWLPGSERQGKRDLAGDRAI